MKITYRTPVCCMVLERACSAQRRLRPGCWHFAARRRVATRRAGATSTSTTTAAAPPGRARPRPCPQRPRHPPVCVHASTQARPTMRVYQVLLLHASVRLCLISSMPSAQQCCLHPCPCTLTGFMQAFSCNHPTRMQACHVYRWLTARSQPQPMQVRQHRSPLQPAPAAARQPRRRAVPRRSGARPRAAPATWWPGRRRPWPRPPHWQVTAALQRGRCSRAVNLGVLACSGSAWMR